jgi:hypothetical protein
MEIRKVQMQDIPQIKALADSLVVTQDSQDSKIGFYDYSLTLEQYQKRCESDLFLVSCRDSELEGFCMAYDSEFVKRLVEREPSLREDVIFNYLGKLNEGYVYVDQLAVGRPKTFVGSASACQLIDKIKELSKGKGSLVAVVPHYPWKNSTAIRFHEHQGTRLVEEIGNKDKLVFGVYRLDLV